MTRSNSLAAFTALAGILAVPMSASATDLSTSAGFLFDIEDGLGSAFGTDGVVSDGGTADGVRFDSYDSAFRLTVNGSAYNNLADGVVSGGGRIITLPAVTLGSLRVSRIIYVPATGGNYVRYLELVENPTGSPITATIAVNANLGSDGSESVTGSASGDTVASPIDAWFGTDSATDSDLALTFVIQANEPTVRAATAGRTSGNVDFSFTASVPAAGRVAVMHFGIQQTTPALGAAEAMAILAEPESIYFGLDTLRDAIINWGVRTEACAGADGSACTVTGVGAGRCYGGACCAGCWDGTRCNSGRGATACGVAGAMCASCSDDDLCTSDVCTAGVCTNPNAPSGTACDDGAFCTATDRCDGAGSCLGSGTPCDDGASCTTDSCNELTGSCVNAMLPDTCIISGMCVPAGTPNPTNGCEVCNAAVSTTAWTPVAPGTTCGTERCSGGRYFPAGSCTTTGICAVPSARDCPTGVCTGRVCEGACTADSCAAGEYCSPTTLMCTPLIADGGACSFSSTCMSGICTDNVCCESVCDGTCERCGGTGRCTLITNGADPDRECAGDDVCDGAGACRPMSMMDAGTDAGELDAGSDAGTDAGILDMDSGPLDAGADGSIDANIIRPDVPFGVDGGGVTPTTRGCSCSVPSRSASTPTVLLGLVFGLGLLVARRKR